MFSEKRKQNCVLFSGISFILFGIFLLCLWEKLLQKLVSQKFELSLTSKTYDPWVKSQVPIYVQYYFFNWTNPSNMKEPNYKPKFTEVGPYKFWEKIEKVNVTWNDNGTVTYKRIRRWYFDEEASNGSLQDQITTINTIALMAARLVKTMPIYSRIPMNMMIAGTQKLPVTKTVSEFLYEGYTDPLLTAGRQWPPISSKVPYDKFERGVATKFVPTFENNNKLGSNYRKADNPADFRQASQIRNGSATFDGTYNVETGKNGMDLFGSVSLWNYKNQTGFFPGACGQVKGSGGEFWPWNIRKANNVYLFSPDLCRYIQYDFSQEMTVDGLDGYKYVAGSDLFDNGTSNEKNECFCNGQCLAAGVLNISSCRFGAPVFTSFPHFYLADPSYVESIEGMKPNQHLHENYILLEPVYGMPMDIAARIQINVLVQPNKQIVFLDGIKQFIFPVFWLNQRVTIPSEKLFVIRVLRKLPTVNFVLAIIFILGGLIAVLGFILCKMAHGQKRVQLAKFSREKSGSPSRPPLFENTQPLLENGKKKSSLPEVTSVKPLNTEL